MIHLKSYTHVKPKIVPLYAVPEAGEKCPVNIIDIYIDKLPKNKYSPLPSAGTVFFLYSRFRAIIGCSDF
jgi:hypothetical protein